MANDSIRGRQVVLRLTNKSGGALVEGDVVIISSGTAAAITTTTTAGLATDAIGVCLESIAGDAIGRVAISGYVPKINLSGAASLGDTFATHSVAKQAAPAATRGTGHFGEVLGTGTTPAALLWGMPDNSAAGGAIATDTIWDAAGDLVQGTGANTAAKLSIGTANQLLRVNSGATAVEWASVGRVLISEIEPGGTTTASWTSIPATYTHLCIEYVARSTKAGATTALMYCYLNNDTTAGNYRLMEHTATGSNTNAAYGNDEARIGTIPGATGLADCAGYGTIQILWYAKTTFHKVMMNRGGLREGAAVSTVFQIATDWESTTAVNRVDCVLADNFTAGSFFRLYGVF